MIVDRDGKALEPGELAQCVAADVFGNVPARFVRATPYGGAAGASWRLDYEVAGGSRALFVKLPAETGARHALFAARLRDEYRVSCEIKAGFPETPALRTVSPAGYIEAVQGYASWAAPGANLEALLRRDCRRWSARNADAPRWCALAADWIMRLHALPSPYVAADLRALLDTYYDDRLVTLTRLRRAGLSERQADVLKSTLMQMVDGVLAAEPVVRCHNDYSPHNVLVDAQGLCVLDYSFAGPGLPAFDIACFWHKLDDIRESLIADPARVTALQRAFVDGLDTGFDLAQDASRLGLARLVLSKMITILRAPARRPDLRCLQGLRLRRWRRWLDSGLDPRELGA